MKTNVTISLNFKEIKLGKEQAKKMGLSLSAYIGQLIRDKDGK